jgi:AcrR family transcriptional regulator
MTSRPYRLGQRQVAAEQTRARIIAAARKLLGVPHDFSVFTVDAIAAEAGVARMTVFNQFGSKRGLLEALFDDLAVRGLVERVRTSFMQADPADALCGLIGAFGGFWSSDRIVIRRIRGLASMDTDFELAVRARDERRREGLRAIISRLTDKYKTPPADARDEAIEVLHTLTSFETFDNLAGGQRTPEQVVPLVCRLALAFLDLSTARNRLTEASCPSRQTKPRQAPRKRLRSV